MAMNLEEGIKKLLKIYYKDGVENLMFRNSPVVKEITKERVEGKSQNFSAMVGRGGAVGGNYLKAIKAAKKGTANIEEFAVTPGQIFSVYTMSAKEVEAAKTQRGAYAPIAGAKMFAATESFRKTVAQSFYGDGYGVLCKIAAGNNKTFTNDTQVLKMPTHAIMCIDIGTILSVKAAKNTAAGSEKLYLMVTKINGNEVTCTSNFDNNPKHTAEAAVGDYICLDGSVDGKGNPLLPIGLAGWLPTDRTILDGGKEFFGVSRDKNPDRLAGAFYDGTKDKTLTDAVEALMQKIRRQGGVGDLIVMNDNDFRRYAAELETTNVFATMTSSRSKKEGTNGMSKVAAAFSTNYIENIYDDPYCPEGVFYILDKEYIKLWSYTNMEKTNDGVAANNPGKPDVMEAGNDGTESKPYGLIIDDYLNVKPGEDGEDGPTTMVSILAYFSWAITNPSCNGVGLFPPAK